MGTHPIFESDFDCLTECRLFSLVICRMTPGSVILKIFSENMEKSNKSGSEIGSASLTLEARVMLKTQ